MQLPREAQVEFGPRGEIPAEHSPSSSPKRQRERWEKRLLCLVFRALSPAELTPSTH